MARTILPLLLIAVAAGELGPINDIPDIIDWLRAHGEDVVKTFEECAPLPGMRQKMSKTCSKDTAPGSGEYAVAEALVYAMYGLEHMNSTFAEAVKHSEVTKQIMSWAAHRITSYTKQSIEAKCHDSECMKESAAFASAIAPCYSSVMCAAIESMPVKTVNFTECKGALQEYVDNTMQLFMGKRCLQDSWTKAGEDEPYYCGRLYADMQVRSLDCLAQITYVEVPLPNTPSTFKCDPKCVQEWNTIKGALPTCSKYVKDMSMQLYTNAIKMMVKVMGPALPADIADIAKKLPEARSFDDVCMPHFLAQLLV